jgi:hypothetical protein
MVFFKWPAMKSGEVMSLEDKNSCKDRKGFWIDFLDNISDDTGFFDPEEPRNICVEKKRYEVIVAELSAKIHKTVFCSLNTIPYMVILLELVTENGF